MGAAVAGWTVAAVLLQVAGLSLFLYGFFPVKPTLHGFSGAESYRMPSCGPVSAGEQEPALPPNQLRSLYKVIDGLPAEFVLGRGRKPPSKEMMESMPYTQSLLAGCKAAGYHAKAAAPTVTMPRLKAMVSGAIGGFLDVAFNFNTQAFLEDNLLDQLHMIGCKLVMLGDETWIKLFPTLFVRQDGVSSFYVRDTVEVDFNVTRHLEFELAAKDWSAMVVVSDHGMTEGGNHGGSSYEETDSLALFIGHSVEGPHCSPYDQNEALQKPFYLLISAILLMTMSCLFLMGTVSCLFKGQSLSQVDHHSDSYLDQRWHLDEVFILTGIFLYIISLGSSSFVEEEQYTWNFLTSTLYLVFLIKTVQSMLKGSSSTLVYRAEGKSFDGNNFSYVMSYELTPGKRDGYKLCTVLIVLVAGRVLRAWHQGGINWVQFPDISKLLAQVDSSIVKSLQTISVLAVVALYSVSLMLLRARSKVFIIGVWLCHVSCGLLVLLHIWENQINTSLPINHSTASTARLFYAIASVSISATVLASPWIFPIYSTEAKPASSDSNPVKDVYSHGISNSVFLTGITYTMFWCLLQLLLQQPINAIPLLLIFLQTVSSVAHFSLDKTLHKQWVQVIAMQFLGMAGYFGLGNTNSLASIDVAGAFIGISSYSTVFSGILMFIITYGSPLMLYLGMVVHLSVKDSDDISAPQQLKWSYILDKMVTLPCLLPLLINSVALTSYTIVLLLMRNHLFVWSVFSPKIIRAKCNFVEAYQRPLNFLDCFARREQMAWKSLALPQPVFALRKFAPSSHMDYSQKFGYYTAGCPKG
ncbi:GPI ethanolamine phosphate transferase 2 [Dichanthelium oligosanthes]|uniref:GPI ethanolamine phosphate transferase 2 n=1 Tax=Dichanthelium oligosanthes TaxID=888268 RepID=A0A1E5VKR3_9POAL|nr:GPI ethanolamine phosphate transferase 2 [Dichanthelium oligosanthes]